MCIGTRRHSVMHIGLFMLQERSQAQSGGNRGLDSAGAPSASEARAEECSLKNLTCHRGMEWGGTHHQFWMSPSGSGLYLPLLAMAGLVGGWGWGSNPPSCVTHHQHSQDAVSDTRNGCVKSPQSRAQVSGPVE